MAVITEIMISELEFAQRIDAELYNPNLKASYCDLLASTYERKKMKKVCMIKSGSTPPDRDDALKTGPILFKTTDVRNGILSSYENYYHITESIHHRMSSTSIKNHDVLLNIVGATLGVIGRVGYISNFFNEANITQAMVLLRIKDEIIMPGYLFSYLCTKYAQDQIKRYARPTGQYNLNLIEVGQIEVPIIEKKKQLFIHGLIESAVKLLNDSKRLYNEAEQFLEQELGLDKIEFENPISHEASFSEVLINNRSDAEFYHSKYKPYLNNILNYKAGSSPLISFCELVPPNYNPKRHPDTWFNYLEIGKVNVSDGSYSTS